MNVDLASIPAPSQEEKISIFDRIQINKQPNRLDLGQLNSSQMELYRQRNGWRDCIKKSIKEICRDLMVLDSEKSY